MNRVTKMKAARTARGLTTLQLGLLVGANPSTISRIERGVQGVSPALAKRIAEVLGVDPAEIIFIDRPQHDAA